MMTMRRSIIGTLLLSALIFAAIPVYGDTITITIDNVPVVSDVDFEFKDNRTMVPLRVISENLGALVHWSDGQASITKDGIQIFLSDIDTYIKSSRTMVPLRFITETFGATVNYKDGVVEVITQSVETTEDMLMADLLKHPELIPHEPVLGGTMAFYKEKSKVLSDRWVFAYFEDGHVFGHMLLGYSIDQGKISWQVIDSYLAQ